MNHLDIFNEIDKMHHALRDMPRSVDGNIDPLAVLGLIHIFECAVLTDLESQVQRMVADV